MVSVNVNNFADGVPLIHLANVKNIKAEGLHEEIFTWLFIFNLKPTIF